VWDGLVGKMGWGFLFVLERYGELMKIFSQENIL
jgi:hypothetical protein